MNKAVATIRTLLPADNSVTTEQIADAVENIMLMSTYRHIDKAELMRAVNAFYRIHIDDFGIIESQERRRPWINSKKASIDWKFWNRYRDYIQIDKNLPDTVINQLDKLTDRTLDGLFDPTVNASIHKYGLVVGQVHSGKTANYSGLICKAADAGFKLIIVLAGIHNNLRSQTQLRIDEGFLGFDTQHERAFRENNKWIGVGKIDPSIVAHSLTSSLYDFNAGAANSSGINFNTNEPIIAVVKKNVSILKRLYEWLATQSVDINGKKVIRNKSLLLIDDEADNASINTNISSDDATAINFHIRQIIGLFEKSGYVGYTATPFANIFIPITSDDLFPKDFIVNIPAPSNYIGPERIFGFQLTEDNDSAETILPIVRRIEDAEPLMEHLNKKGSSLPELPESLRIAVKSFIITCAIRRLRGQTNAHNSMLVHISRLVKMQQYIKNEVERIFDFYRRGIEMNIPDTIEEMRRVFEVDSDLHQSFVTTTDSILNSAALDDPLIQTHEWIDVLPHLNEAASRIKVMGINGGSADALNYYDNKEGLSVIAVGGDKLSRGLTLEGLSISYYLRASRMYDTLMQMGRWFGYRPGYADLCRLFTTRELNEWFCHITLASEELRKEFDDLTEIVGSTPEQYALRVRTHPGTLQISASNKIRSAVEIRVSWSGRLVESYQLSKDPNIIAKNLVVTTNFINSIGPVSEEKSNYFLWRNIPFESVKQFLSGFQVHENLRRASPENLLRFIELKYRSGELNNWNIGVITKGKGKEFIVNEALTVTMIERTEESKGADSYSIRKSHIISPNDEFIDLSETERKLAEEATEKKNKEKKQDEGKENNQTTKTRLDGNWVRNNIRKPGKVLLLIYFLDPKKANIDDDSKPIIGFAISFPGSDTEDAVSYAIPEQLLPYYNQDDESEDREEDED